jgi:hypothetical protein
MLAAGYSAKVTEKDEQGVSTFEDFAEGDLFAFGGGQGKVWRGGVLSKCHVFQCQVSGYALPK